MENYKVDIYKVKDENRYLFVSAGTILENLPSRPHHGWELDLDKTKLNVDLFKQTVGQWNEQAGFIIYAVQSDGFFLFNFSIPLVLTMGDEL